MPIFMPVYPTFEKTVVAALKSHFGGRKNYQRERFKLYHCVERAASLMPTKQDEIEIGDSYDLALQYVCSQFFIAIQTNTINIL